MIICFLIIFVILIISDFYCLRKNWKYFNKEESWIDGQTYIKFKDWKKLYEILPENYKKGVTYLKYIKGKQYQILFSFLDYYKYLFYIEYLNKKDIINKKEKNKIKENKILLDIIKDTKEEITKLEEQSKKELNGFYDFLKYEINKE